MPFLTITTLEAQTSSVAVDERRLSKYRLALLTRILDVSQKSFNLNFHVGLPYPFTYATC